MTSAEAFLLRIWKHRFFLSLFSCKFEDITNWAQIFTGVLFYANWDTPSDNTGLWQLPKVSSALKPVTVSRTCGCQPHWLTYFPAPKKVTVLKNLEWKQTHTHTPTTDVWRTAVLEDSESQRYRSTDKPVIFWHFSVQISLLRNLPKQITVGVKFQLGWQHDSDAVDISIPYYIVGIAICHQKLCSVWYTRALWPSHFNQWKWTHHLWPFSIPKLSQLYFYRKQN